MITTKKIYIEDKRKRARNQSVSLQKKSKHNKRHKGKKNNKKCLRQITMNKMAIVSPILSIITLNINPLTPPQSKDIEWTTEFQKKKKYPTICYLKETHFSFKDTYQWKEKGLEKIFHENKKQKEKEVVYLYEKKTDFKSKSLTKDKQGYYIMING